MTLKITTDSHTDHGLTPAQLAWAIAQAPESCPFFLRELTLPDHLGTVPSALRGPVAGDPPIDEATVTYAVRGNRDVLSRMCDLPKIASRKVVIVGGEHEGAYILFTAYGGPSAPREVIEAERLHAAGKLSAEALADARNFWCLHALSTQT